MPATRSKVFEREIKELNSLLEDNKEFMDQEVQYILETCLEMVETFPRAVKKYDMAELHDFMSTKAEEFYEQFNDQNEGTRGVTFEKNITYIYDFASISFLRGAVTVLYPFMLLGAMNYTNFIPLLCRNLRKMETPVTLAVFIDCFYELYVRGKPRLYKRDIEFLKDISRRIIDSWEVYNELIRTHEKTERYYRLMRLRTVGIRHNLNFPVLGLIPYIHLADQQVEVPDYLKPFVENEFRSARMQKGFQILRLFLLPSSHEQEWASNLAELGLTGRLMEKYRRYNWNSLVRTRRGTWKWNLNFNGLKSAYDIKSERIELYTRAKMLENPSSGYIRFLDTVHRYDIVTPEHVALMIDTTVQSVYRYLRDSIKGKVFLPEWIISRIGLDGYYQVIFKNNQVNQRLAAFLEGLPKMLVMRSQEFSQYLLSLPFVAITKLNRLLKSIEEQGDIEILSRRRITLDARSIIRGVNLSEVWKKLSDDQK